MGWNDDEEKTGWPDWATTPIAWIGCLAVATLPAGMVLALWDAFLPRATPPAHLVIYLLSLALMVVAVRPWTIR